MFEIVEIKHSLPEDIAAFVSESERAGYRFVRRLREEWASGANRFDEPGEGLFAARVRGRAVGLCGLNVDPFAGDPMVGRVRHLYLLEAWRRRGAGRMLVNHVAAMARLRFRELRLRTDLQEAAAFYERVGFRAVPYESATHAWVYNSRAHVGGTRDA